MPAGTPPVETLDEAMAKVVPAPVPESLTPATVVGCPECGHLFRVEEGILIRPQPTRLQRLRSWVKGLGAGLGGGWRRWRCRRGAHSYRFDPLDPIGYKVAPVVLEGRGTLVGYLVETRCRYCFKSTNVIVLFFVTTLLPSTRYL
jgi:hypothetical protein